MPATNFDEERVPLRGPDRQKMPDGPDEDADQPEAQAEANGTGQRSVQDRNGPRRSAQQDLLGQRPVDRHGKAGNGIEALETSRHQSSAPPPKEKKERKKLEAAKAIDRPNTI